MLLGGIDEVKPKEIYIRAETNIFRAFIKSSVAISDTIPFRILQVRCLEKGQGIVFPGLPKSSVSGSYRHFLHSLIAVVAYSPSSSSSSSSTICLITLLSNKSSINLRTGKRKVWLSRMAMTLRKRRTEAKCSGALDLIL